MAEKSSGGSAGIGIGGLIFVILLVGKLAGFFPNIGWIWVISSIIWAPLLAMLTVIIFIGAGAGVVFGGAAILDKISAASRKRRLAKEANKQIK